jgi:uncharacterized OB-fold protein
MSQQPGIPVPDLQAPDFAPFWRACQQRRLVVQCCSRGHLSWPPRPACPRCHDLTRNWQEVEGAGRLYSWTVVHRTAVPGFQALTPYVVAIVELAGHPEVRLVGRCLSQPEKLHIGMAMRVVFEQVTAEFTLPVWRPEETGG